MPSMRKNCWNTKPISCERTADNCLSDMFDVSTPAKRTLPDDGRSSVPMMCSNVDLPEPEGPTIAASSPSSMRNDTPHVVLQRLVHTVNETCNIGTLLNGEVIYLDRVEAEHWPLRLHYTIGSRVPLHCSAIGKLYLALASSVRRRRLLQSLELRRYTGTTLTDATQLEAELRQIRKEQVSFDREEYLAGVVCMAVPVIGKNGELLAALAIQAPEARMNVQTARRHLPALRQAAEELAGIFLDRP